MILFKKKLKKNTSTPFSKATPMAIYGYLKNDMSPVQIFKQHNVPLEEAQMVLDEIERLENEVFSKIRGTWVTTPEVPEERNEEGVVTKEAVPAVHFTLGTQSNLASSLAVTNITATTLITDLIAYYPDYDNARTWTQFKDAVING